MSMGGGAYDWYVVTTAGEVLDCVVAGQDLDAEIATNLRLIAEIEAAGRVAVKRIDNNEAEVISFETLAAAELAGEEFRRNISAGPERRR